MSHIIILKVAIILCKKYMKGDILIKKKNHVSFSTFLQFAFIWAVVTYSKKHYPQPLLKCNHILLFWNFFLFLVFLICLSDCFHSLLVSNFNTPFQPEHFELSNKCKQLWVVGFKKWHLRSLTSASFGTASESLCKKLFLDLRVLHRSANSVQLDESRLIFCE